TRSRPSKVPTTVRQSIRYECRYRPLTHRRRASARRHFPDRHAKTVIAAPAAEDTTHPKSAREIRTVSNSRSGGVLAPGSWHSFAETSCEADLTLGTAPAPQRSPTATWRALNALFASTS